MIVKYNKSGRFLEYWDGDKLVSDTHIDQVYRENFNGENICDWEVVLRMGLRYHQEKVEVWAYNPDFNKWFLYEYLYTKKVDNKYHFEPTGEWGGPYKI